VFFAGSLLEVIWNFVVHVRGNLAQSKTSARFVLIMVRSILMLALLCFVTRPRFQMPFGILNLETNGRMQPRLPFS
jgi:hypothetical protein